MNFEQIQQIKLRTQSRLNELEDRESLDASEQMELFYLWKAKHFPYDDLQDAVKTLRDAESFYDYSQYRPAVELIEDWLNVLSLSGYPGQFSGFSLSIRSRFNLMSSKDLSDHRIAERIAAPFESYFQDILLPMVLLLP
ncbi:hypothetical protein CBW65_09950 [Tumebacillus avium]|uniref:Uncharacterized protein n=1 Tax=Tumebacillus avium TaxID=1903704 RepID=A0A1Y0ILV9_9BACL|nr:hypothetical protein [Tumebacillus avium]ARU61280.1 hypothetical protein CBW65_09950 [Tumebacillus avium]